MTLAAFLSIVLLHLVAAISPGPSFVMAVRTAAAEGFRVALMVALGLGLGAVTWALAALLGLHVLFEVAPVALTLLKVAGGLFLIWIAFQTWRHATTPLPEPGDGVAPRTAWSALRLGVLTQLANPKAAVFFGAVFLGFVPEGTPVPVMALLLLVILVNETLWYGFVGRVFSLARTRAAYRRMKTWIDRAFGALIAAFGARIAIG